MVRWWGCAGCIGYAMNVPAWIGFKAGGSKKSRSGFRFMQESSWRSDLRLRAGSANPLPRSRCLRGQEAVTCG